MGETFTPRNPEHYRKVTYGVLRPIIEPNVLNVSYLGDKMILESFNTNLYGFVWYDKGLGLLINVYDEIVNDEAKKYLIDKGFMLDNYTILKRSNLV